MEPEDAYIDEDEWFVKFKDCSCCHGHVYGCPSEMCHSLGLCVCAYDDPDFEPKSTDESTSPPPAFLLRQNVVNASKVTSSAGAASGSSSSASHRSRGTGRGVASPLDGAPVSSSGEHVSSDMVEHMMAMMAMMGVDPVTFMASMASQPPLPAAPPPMHVPMPGMDAMTMAALMYPPHFYPGHGGMPMPMYSAGEAYAAPPPMHAPVATHAPQVDEAAWSSAPPSDAPADADMSPDAWAAAAAAASTNGSATWARQEGDVHTPAFASMLPTHAAEAPLYGTPVVTAPAAQPYASPDGLGSESAMNASATAWLPSSIVADSPSSPVHPTGDASGDVLHTGVKPAVPAATAATTARSNAWAKPLLSKAGDATATATTPSAAAAAPSVAPATAAAHKDAPAAKARVAVSAPASFQAVPIVVPNPAAPVPAPAPTRALSPRSLALAEHEKELKRLRKKLRDITDLEVKDRATLCEDQAKKLAGKAAVETRIKEVEAEMTKLKPRA